MAQEIQLSPALQLAHQCQQLTPQELWELDLSQTLDLPLTRHGQILLTWCHLLDCQVDLLTEH